MTRLSASDIYVLYRPVRCGLRVHLRERGEPMAEPGLYEQLLFRLGSDYEQRHLETFPEVTDLHVGTHEQRAARTREAVARGDAVIYQGVLIATRRLNGAECELVGIPDLLVKQEGGYAVRDVKMARRVNAKDHPEIELQLGLYGWLFAEVFGAEPVGLEVFNGAGELVPVQVDPERLLAALESIAALKTADEEPYEPVGWTKCSDCGFRGRCWPAAEKRRDVALVCGVDQGLATALDHEGVRTFDDLLERFDDAADLAAFERFHGQKKQRVGQGADRILTMARAMAEEREIILAPPRLPVHPNYVMFDLEGLPPQLDELETVYMWGFQVFGEDGREFQAGLAGFGDDGDREGWEDFLAKTAAVFDSYGDIPWVHWATYEKTKLSAYIERFGDRDGLAERVLANLLDLLSVTRDAIALPLPSYSLKVVEKHVGFARQLPDTGGAWSMAKYIEAVETDDEAVRQAAMDEILAYNREDLEATWAVLQWLRSKSAAH